ncbi:hypothetical protein TVAG_350060 [Trichomonas vaginalis G3]|uniref:DUF3447 domain-containing protein n=1 Tax=Trichomonas vaginalis (strain ATCC PRA-98 / G3) TaxID=412133 RepID=A2F3I7_TRIV3|nr:Ankyrin repeat family [Trichomonas vaginalis G3]EAY00510.1 hypothetical protein TVAG_350060 [Trichomonas vaginalis G3]KAI5550199.1 Ankyrin repeat family [Trichomonas vaginalis G3]|eukprot:XP_001313439.1 hypothetical protein [Trichomonas vaginalis G3]
MMFDSIRRGLDQYFIPEFNLTRLKRPIDGLTDRKGNLLKEMTENNFEKYKEFLIYENKKIFQELLEANDIKSFTKLVESGSYQFTNEISLSALYSNYNFFILCSKHQKITNNVVESAYSGGNKEIIKYCKQHYDFSEEKYMKFCIKYQRNELIEEMIEKGFGWTINDAVHSLNYRLILFSLFLGKKESKEEDEYRRSNLHFCGRFGDYLIGEFLAEKGFDVNAVDDDGRSVAYEAASSSRFSFLKMLISKNADLEKKNIDGISAYKRVMMSKDQRTRNVVCNMNK